MLKFTFGFMHLQAHHVLVRLGPGLHLKCRPFNLLPGARSSELVLSSSLLGLVTFPELSRGDSDYLTVGCLLL